jgi:hypothetical protein
VVMPVRWASGQVPIYQLLLAMALTTTPRSDPRRCRLVHLPPRLAHHRSPGEAARGTAR